jgi:predicted DNA-binding ribbon-helix-helix protein
MTSTAPVVEIDQSRHGNLASAIRLVLGRLCAQTPGASASGFGAGTANSAFAPNETRSL